MDNELRDISNSLLRQLGYGIGHILNDVCASLWFTYMLVFFHLVLQFSASQAGSLMLIGQVVDALSTPFVGYCSDHTDNSVSMRYGKRKLWHLFGTACVLGSFPFIYSECLGCTLSHKWAQMFYYAAFITIFQIGWASIQISHLSLIPELSGDDHTRTHLTAVRFGFTVFSNLFVYIITWLILHINGDNTEQVCPSDAWKFRDIVYIVLSVGAVTSIIFHISVKENHIYRVMDYNSNVNTHCDMLRRPTLYQVAGVYMSTRLVVNISQVLIPLYLHLTLGLAALSLATVPLAMYMGSLVAAVVMRLAPKSCSLKLKYTIGAIIALSAFIWIYYGTEDVYKEKFIYVVAVLIGFGGSIMLVVSLALTAEIVGSRIDASAFVYGLMSFTDKLACGVAIAAVQFYADGSDAVYYRNTLSFVCGGAAFVGLTLTVLLPKFNIVQDLVNTSTNTEDTEGIITDL